VSLTFGLFDASPTVLILGGTGEARALAERLVARGGLRVISSLAGRVARPRLPVGEVRIGGFGGVEGLAAWLRAERAVCVVDATHPFAERISANAADACAATATPLLRLQRPGWSAREGDDWRWVDSLAEAAALLPAAGSRVFLTTGRQGLAAFAEVDDAFFLIRCVDPPEPPLPMRHELLLDRGPYTVEGECSLIDAHRLDVVITKDSGGALTVAKLDAARERGLPVIVVRRPSRPQLPEVPTATEAAAWVAAAVG
jgi:precorrin-6A/cobalt-precorrin-6A reductase